MVRREVGYTDDVVARDEVASRAIDRPGWSPAQIISLVVGILFLIMGGVALARTGFDFDESTRTEVLGLSHSALLALIELGIGLALVAAGALPGAGRGTMVFFGALMLGFGIIAVAQPTSFDDALGTEEATGWLYIVAGALLLIAAMVSPTLWGSERRAVSRSVDSGASIR